MTAVIDRRSVLAAIALMLGGCAPYGGMAPGAGFYPFRQSEFASAYGPIMDQGHEIPPSTSPRSIPICFANMSASRVRTDRERSW